ncbi:MAG: hypothetical protein ACYDHH_20965 [Solirubrobacteraceae bacterium]
MIAVVFVILAGIGIKSCQDSALTSSLKDYANGVASILQQSAGGSNSTSGKLFVDLTTRTDPVSMRDSVTSTLGLANGQLRAAEGLSVPDQMSAAQSNILDALTDRRDGIQTIALNIESARSSNRDAIAAINAAMAAFLASDVAYKQYAGKEIVAQLRADGIPVGGVNGVILPNDQFLPDLGWLDPRIAASRIGATFHATASGNSNYPVNPNLLHGHKLNSVSVQGTALNPQATNAVTASPAPTFTLNFTNSGQTVEYRVKCDVTLGGSSIKGTTTIPQTTAGQTTTCDVPLKSSPSPGQYTVTATVEGVPGEKALSNNSISFPVTFQ